MTAPRTNGYRNDICNAWLYDRSVRFFANFVRNWDGPVRDSDFFDVVTDSRFGNESDFLPVLLRHCPLKTLKKEGIVEPASSGELTPEAFDTD